ncbi:MAG: alkaline phosphatase family protein, partial [Gaiellales bacterium]
MWRWLIPVAVACVAAIALVKTSQHPVHVGEHTGPTTSTDPVHTTGFALPCGTRKAHPAHYNHVIWIMFGERGYQQVMGKHAKAFYIKQLAGECGLAAGYGSITHPALPNLIASVAGTTAGLTRNHDTTQVSVPSLFKQVPSWGVYMESMPSACTTTDAPLAHYVARMNAAIFFAGLPCRKRDLPLGTPARGKFATALAAGKLPRFSFIVPNECDSMSFSHSCGASKLGDFVALGDFWLRTWMRHLLSSKEYRAGSTVIFITWVDGVPGAPLDHDCVQQPLPNCHVPTLVVAPSVRPGTVASRTFTHYS